MPVLCQSAAATKPGICALDDPAAEQDFKAFGGAGSLYCLERPIIDPRVRFAQFRLLIAAIGEDVAQPWAGPADGNEHDGGAVTILDVGGTNNQPNHEADGVDDDMPFASLDPSGQARGHAFLPAPKPQIPPLSVAFTLWL